MKEYLKKFDSAAAADNYRIEYIPFTTSVAENPIQNLVCNKKGKRLVNVSGVVQIQQDIPKSNEIWYTSSDGKIVTPHDTSEIPTIVSNKYSDGKGVIKFEIDITSIGTNTFESCTSLTSMTIPDSVTSIGTSAFYGCSGLIPLIIPASVTSIGNQAFYNVPNIVYNGTATGEPWLSKAVNGYIDGYLVYSDETKTQLLACSSAVQGEITIPESVISIRNDVLTFVGNEAFGVISAKIIFNKLYSTYTTKIFSSPSAGSSYTYNVEFNISEIPTDYNISSMLPQVIGDGKGTITYNIYTDYEPCKDQALALVTQKTIVNVYHIDGTPWE